MATAYQVLDAPHFVASFGQREEQVKELLMRFSEAVEGGSPRQMVQRVASDLVVSLKANRRTGHFDRVDDAMLRHLETFEINYALGQTDCARPMLAQLHDWWQERTLSMV